MRLSVTKDLTPLRIAANARVDAQAEEVRGIYLTLGAGQSMVYDQKRREAEDYVAKLGLGETPAPADYPHLGAESTQNGITLYDQAVIYLTMAQLWLTISPIIEMKRLAAKDAIASATTPATIDAATVVDWSPVGGPG